MNVLILTPDAVGSTLLQRMLTIYMQFHQFDRPVINLHELTNGLAKYYSPEFNQELVGKRAVKNWGYYQSLEEVVELLGSVDHYKTSRLAHYHIRNRGDTVAEQIPFYNYLNENFYIISCRRANVFEHALSMTLNKITKKLNVYTADEKIDTFYNIYQSGIDLDHQSFIHQLNAYRDYINWSDQYFNVSSYFNYEQDVPRIEQFILNLPLFNNQPELVTWEKNFGITFNTWNKMHYACSDLGSLMIESTSEINLPISNSTPLNKIGRWENGRLVEQQKPILLPTTVNDQCTKQHIQHNGVFSLLNQDRQDQLSFATQGYKEGQKTIDQMVNLGIIISGPPIKKQTLSEKMKIVKNFDALIQVYNNWAEKNASIATPIVKENLSTQIQQENQFWTRTQPELMINNQSS
jgi:hypothetical protein